MFERGRIRGDQRRKRNTHVQSHNWKCQWIFFWTVHKLYSWWCSDSKVSCASYRTRTKWPSVRDSIGVSTGPAGRDSHTGYHTCPSGTHQTRAWRKVDIWVEGPQVLLYTADAGSEGKSPVDGGRDRNRWGRTHPVSSFFVFKPNIVLCCKVHLSQQDVYIINQIIFASECCVLLNTLIVIIKGKSKYIVCNKLDVLILKGCLIPGLNGIK